MSDSPQNPLENPILKKIVAAQAVTAADVEAMEQMVRSDWLVDKTEVEALFQANQAIGPRDEHCPEWTRFFVATVTRLVVMDMATPGEIDTQEGDWLGGLLDRHSVKNESERNLMAEIQNTTTTIHGSLGNWIQPHGS